jgi:CHAD domain-containing protein
MWENLHQYLETQCVTIAELLPAIGEKADKKAIHKLRVSIKKARSCLALARHISEHSFKGKKYIRLLKVVHLSVGEVRALQLQQESLNHYTAAGPQRYRFFHALLKSRYQLALQQAQAIAAAFPSSFIEKLPERLAKKQFNTKAASEKELGIYFQEQYAAIAVPAGQGPEERWHDLRKDVKRLHHQLEIAAPHLVKQTTETMLQFTDEAGSRLGNWHDLIAFRQFMRESLHIMRNKKIAVPAGTEKVLDLLAADIRGELQYCKKWILAKPAL